MVVALAKFLSYLERGFRALRVYFVVLVQLETVDHEVNQVSGIGNGQQAVDIVLVAVVLRADLPLAVEASGLA